MTPFFDAAAQQQQRLSDGPDWTFELLETYLAEIDRVAKLYHLDTYPHQIEVITSEQMMDAYSSIGMPINYAHWSFGKKFIETEQLYKQGQQGLAYEIVINSNPCIAYLMEENTLTMQALVMAHACYGHNSFLKITICSVAGPMPDQSSITYCLLGTIFQIVKKSTALKPWSSYWIPVMH